MENLTLSELRYLLNWALLAIDVNSMTYPLEWELIAKIKQAIADKEFEEKTRPLNF